MTGIKSTHPEYDCAKDKWQDVRDAVTANYKGKVIPIEYGTSSRVTTRNKNYIDRAIYYNFTACTLRTLVGLATQKDMIVNLPKALEYLKTSCTPDKLTLEQLRRYGIGEICQTSRAILLTDFPELPANPDSETVSKINPKAKILRFKAEELESWDTIEKNGEEILCFMKFKREVTKRVSRWEFKKATQYTVLELNDAGHYVYTILDEQENILKSGTPKVNGVPLEYIPVDIAGGDDNNLEVDESYLYPIAHVNFGHLRNSASYEDNLDAHGQGTLGITSDLSVSQWKELTKNRPIMLGSREAYFLGKNGDMKLCQLQANQESAAAMLRKEQQMVAMGASIITEASANAPVETTQIHQGNKAAPLVNFVKNFEQALNNQIRNCALFNGIEYEDDTYGVECPKDFIPKVVNPQVMAQLMVQYGAGLLPARIVNLYNRQVDLIPDSENEDELIAEAQAEKKQRDKEAMAMQEQTNANQPPTSGEKTSGKNNSKV